ncbi:MAG: ImmA/IrrE family metallo-endopeptidase [Phycisphaerales bacterium]|nr:ImmA/IrrE family metallo-endopeptidase [Phycisphaerales bacterium]
MSRVSTNQFRVPYLHERQIESEAELLLREWSEKGHKVSVPIPLEDLVECHLRLPFQVEDLRKRFGGHDVLGAIWFGDGAIRVDSSLDPVLHPEMLGRYNFTIAHEVGHWRLHREHLRRDPAQAMFFNANGEPAFVCRDGDTAPEEWQANHFAGCLLMPRDLLRIAWRQWRGNDDPVSLADLGLNASTSSELEQQIAFERFCRPLADDFAASAQAMRIRLEALELLVKEYQPGLFG